MGFSWQIVKERAFCIQYNRVYEINFRQSSDMNLRVSAASSKVSFRPENTQGVAHHFHPWQSIRRLQSPTKKPMRIPPLSLRNLIRRDLFPKQMTLPTKALAKKTLSTSVANPPANNRPTPPRLNWHDYKFQSTYIDSNKQGCYHIPAKFMNSKSSCLETAISQGCNN